MWHILVCHADTMVLLWWVLRPLPSHWFHLSLLFHHVWWTEPITGQCAVYHSGVSGEWSIQMVVVAVSDPLPLRWTRESTQWGLHLGFLMVHSGHSGGDSRGDCCSTGELAMLCGCTPSLNQARLIAGDGCREVSLTTCCHLSWLCGWRLTGWVL